MLLEEARGRINDMAWIRFGDLFSQEELATIKKNKGKTGQLLEIAIGKPLSSENCDFEDGELKTNKCDRDGNPQETIFITQISKKIDDLIQNKPFFETQLWEKIRNILYVPVCKEGAPEDWMFFPSIHVDLQNPKFAPLRDSIECDYNLICAQIRGQIDSQLNSGEEEIQIHTANGEYIQIRSKDAKPYNQIFSDVYGQYVSNKNYAFYFKKEFVYKIREIDRCQRNIAY